MSRENFFVTVVELRKNKDTEVRVDKCINITQIESIETDGDKTVITMTSGDKFQSITNKAVIFNKASAFGIMKELSV